MSSIDPSDPPIMQLKRAQKSLRMGSRSSDTSAQAGGAKCSGSHYSRLQVFGALAILGRDSLLKRPVRIAIASVALVVLVTSIIVSGDRRSPMMIFVFLGLMFLARELRGPRSSP